MNQKLKKTPGIYLVGFMGSGKSTAGRLLAEQLGWDFIDLDEQIERLAGCSISTVFEEQGEAAFREMEHRALLAQTVKVRCGQPRVVALGGGAFAYQNNRQAIADAGLSVWLDAPAASLWARVQSEAHRPLAQDQSAFEALLESRREAYAQADLHLDAELPPEIIAQKISQAV